MILPMARNAHMAHPANLAGDRSVADPGGDQLGDNLRFVRVETD